MAGNTGQERSVDISLDEYKDARPWHATPDELTETLQNDDQFEPATFIRRVLASDRSHAIDNSVEIIRVDDGPLLGTMTLTFFVKGSAEPARCNIDNEGIIRDTAVDPPVERGYFVGGESMGETLEEANKYALVRNKAPETEEQPEPLYLPLD